MDFLLFILYSLALAGHAFDAYTTRIGLDHGWREVNPIMRWLMAKSWSLSCAIKLGVAPLLFLPISSFLGDGAAVAYLSVLATVGWLFGIRNYRKLQSAGISIKWFGE